MAKFINKKEQVFDIKLTPYGKHMISMGTFKPVMYAFFDNNIIYDGKHAGITETQNEIGQRIKRDTQYLEGLVLFDDVEAILANKNPPMVEDGSGVNYYDVDHNPIQITPQKDSYRYTSIIGDAHLDGEQQTAPAWKIVCLNGTIESTTTHDEKNNIRIPQVNIALNYQQKIKNAVEYTEMKEENIRNVISRTPVFADNKYIEIINDDLMVYVEELNTDMLTENFDIEIFEIETDAGLSSADSTSKKDAFRRRYFKEDHQKIMGGLITDESLNSFDPIDDDTRGIDFNYTTSSVGYYFDYIKDYQIDPEVACRSVEIFNKESYYIDLDFNCDEQHTDRDYYVDLYGPVTEPEICP